MAINRPPLPRQFPKTHIGKDEMILNRLKKSVKRKYFNKKINTTFVSFTPSLTKLCHLITPKTILEFGPGNSTRLFLEHSQAKLVSIETHPDWYDEYAKEFDPHRVQLLFKEHGWDLSEICQYGENFSLIFIDGGDRVAELKYCYDLIPDDGVVFLHDAHREAYEEGLRRYPFIYFPERHSCILLKNKDLYRAIETTISADYSCSCQYCSSADRKKYFAQFASY